MNSMQWVNIRRYKTACVICLAVIVAMWVQSVCAQVPKDVTICEINMRTGVAGGDLVRVTGVCTVGSDRLGGMLCIISTTEGGPWCCGLKIYDQSESLVVSRGQCLTVVGTVVDYYGSTEILLDPGYSPEVWECGWKIPDPERVSECTFSGAYLSCQVVLEGLTVLSDPDAYGNFTTVDRYGCERRLLMRLTDPVYPVGTEFCSLTGFLDYHFEEYKIRPVDDDSLDPRPLSDCPWLGTACDLVRIRSFVSKTGNDCFTGGDSFIHTLTFTNLCTSRPGLLFDVLEIAGSYWFWPEWTTQMAYDTVQLPELGSRWLEILNFEWPEGVTATMSGTFWTVMMDDEIILFISDIYGVPFCVGP